MPRLPHLVRACAALAASVLLTASIAGQEPQASRRYKIGHIALPAIDLGLVPGHVAEALGGRVPRPSTDSTARYMPGRVLVKYRGEDRYQVVPIDAAEDPERAAERLAARADVEYAQADYIASYDFRPNDPLFAQQWNLSVLGMEEAWEINTGATDAVVVAVLDGGIAYDDVIYEYNNPFTVISEGRRYPPLGRVVVPFAAAPDLAGPNRFVAPRDFIWGDDAPVDLDGHGTHVAGTIGQLTNNGLGVAGMAFNVRLMPVKVVSGDWDFIFDAPNVGTAAVVADGIRYAADNGAKVINMSLGFTGATSLPVIEDALRYAVGRGAFVTVSAGNDFEDGNPVEALAEMASRIDGVMSVGAVNRDLGRAHYSSSRPSVEIAAPGGDFRVGGGPGGVLQQTYDRIAAVTEPLSNPVSAYRAPRFDVFSYRYFQGTSMAAPHVAGLAALLVQQGITSPAAIEAAIKRFAIDRGPAGRDDEYGFGLISPRETLRGLGLTR